jgi:hypothetical protein
MEEKILEILKKHAYIEPNISYLEEEPVITKSSYISIINELMELM